MKKECIPMLLPISNKSSKLSNIISLDNKILSIFNGMGTKHATFYDLYICSTDEIKEVDSDSVWDKTGQYKNEFNELYKIIATTDTSLTIDCKPLNGYDLRKDVKELPSIPQSYINYFIEQYNKGLKPEKVLVEYNECDISACINGCIGLDNCKGNHAPKLNNSEIVISQQKEVFTREEAYEMGLQAILRTIKNHYFDYTNWFDKNY